MREWQEEAHFREGKKKNDIEKTVFGKYSDAHIAVMMFRCVCVCVRGETTAGALSYTSVNALRLNNSYTHASTFPFLKCCMLGVITGVFT